MNDVKITVKKIAVHKDLIEKYENDIDPHCPMKEEMVFVSKNMEMPEGFCGSAWQNLSPYVMILACGGSDIYDGWMKDKNSAMISCNDGFRPVSFLLEKINNEKQE